MFGKELPFLIRHVNGYMKIVRDIIRPVVVLVVITLVVSAALALTYQFTKPEEGASGPDMDLIETAGKEAMPEADGLHSLIRQQREQSICSAQTMARVF